MEAEWEINFGIQAAESLRVDDLIDFRNHDLLLSSSSSASRAGGDARLLPSAGGFSSAGSGYSASFADDIYIPSEEAAELEWLSEFMEDSFSNSTYNCSLFPAQASENCNISTSSDFPQNVKANGNSKKRTGDGFAGGGRRCTHCSSEKTPQWRTGPLGPKTLCNACGVRFKSGRLVPEYRPAASPTFVLTQHSNSHRKVMELRRQKETLVLNGSGELVAGKTLAGL